MGSRTKGGKIMKGHLRERSPGKWAIILDLRDDKGQRKRKWHSFRGTKREAQAESARLITELKSGSYIERNRQSLNDFLDKWSRDWAVHNVSAKSAERYLELLRLHVRPQLGAKAIQSIGVQDLNALYASLHEKLSPRTVKHVHRLLHRVLGHATKWGLVKRNVAALTDAPRVPVKEAAALQLTEIPTMLAGLRGRMLYPIAVVALGTGMRRGELCGLRWRDVDLDGGSLRVEQSLEQTRGGLRFKQPKSARSRRSISLSPAVVAELRAHWKAQQEQRLALGLGKAPADSLVFARWDGKPRSPDKLSTDFSATMNRIGLPHITLHSLRHTHASQLITGGMDILTVSRRLGHGSPAITLNVYGHLLSSQDRAADITQAMLANAGVEG
jgi:integrase